MLRCGFFDSIDGDRKYNARDISKLFDGIILDGIFAAVGDHFSINVHSAKAMTVTVGTGQAWLNHVKIINTSPLQLTFDTGSSNRYDAIVVEVNELKRDASIFIKKDAGKSPSNITIDTQPIDMSKFTNNEYIHQYLLGYVFIRAGQNKILTDDVASKIGFDSPEGIPYVTGPLETLPADETLKQWVAQWTSFYNASSAYLNSFKDDSTDALTDFQNNSTAEINAFKTKSTNEINTFKTNSTSEINTFKTNSTAEINTFKSNGTTAISTFITNSTKLVQDWIESEETDWNTWFDGKKDAWDELWEYVTEELNAANIAETYATKEELGDAVTEVKDYTDTKVGTKANIASPTFTGTPKAPTPATNTNNTQIATTAFVKAVVNALVNGAPETLDTLKEIADAIESNETIVTALNTAIGIKANIADVLPLDGSKPMTGNISYQATHAVYSMIKFIDNINNANGGGIVVGGGGATIIGGGESVNQAINNILSKNEDGTPDGNPEVMYICNDHAIDFYSNLQNGIANAHHAEFTNTGVFKAEYVETVTTGTNDAPGIIITKKNTDGEITRNVKLAISSSNVVGLWDYVNNKWIFSSSLAGNARFIGTADAATKATQDSDGNNIKSTYATKAQLEEVFQSVSDGKELIASAITDKGVTTASDATFQTMANNIGAIAGAQTPIAWSNTSNGSYKFVQYGHTWISNSRGVASSTATSTWTVNLTKATQYTFHYGVNSESSYDKLTITVNGTKIADAISGEKKLSATVTLNAGTNTIVATYTKDSSSDVQNDCGYIVLSDVYGTTIKTQYKVASTPGTTAQVIKPDSGYDGIASVYIPAAGATGLSTTASSTKQTYSDGMTLSVGFYLIAATFSFNTGNNSGILFNFNSESNVNYIINITDLEKIAVIYVKSSVTFTVDRGVGTPNQTIDVSVYKMS